MPMVYRWRVIRSQPGDKEPVYIGQTEELPRRIRPVLTPSKTAKDTDTNKRLHQVFQRFLSEGRKTVVEVLDVEPFEMNGVRFARDTMHDPFRRQALENIFSAIALESAECELLNVVIDPLGKLLKLPPHMLRELLKLLEPGAATRQKS